LKSIKCITKQVCYFHTNQLSKQQENKQQTKHEAVNIQVTNEVNLFQHQTFCTSNVTVLKHKKPRTMVHCHGRHTCDDNDSGSLRRRFYRQWSRPTHQRITTI